MSDSAIVTFALIAAVAGIAYGLYLAMWVFKLDAGNAKMQEIAKAIQEGAGAYMNRQYRTVGVVAAVLFVVLWGAGAFSDKFGMLTAIGFLDRGRRLGARRLCRDDHRGTRECADGSSGAQRHECGLDRGLPRRRGDRSAVDRPGPAGHHRLLYDCLSVGRTGESDPCLAQPRVRRQLDFGVCACGRRNLYQGGGCRRGSGRQSRSGYSGR